MKKSEILGFTADNYPVYRRTDTPDDHIHDFSDEWAIEDAIRQIQTSGTYVRRTMDLGRIVGISALVEEPDESKVYYAPRGKRAGLSRLVDREGTPTSVITVILCQDKNNGNRWTAVSIFPGEQGEREPWDASIQDDPEAIARSKSFWATHALATK